MFFNVVPKPISCVLSISIRLWKASALQGAPRVRSMMDKHLAKPVRGYLGAYIGSTTIRAGKVVACTQVLYSRL